MKSSNIKTKLLAILLIFTLTSANFLFVGETFATEIITEVFSGSKTNENVEFSAYFETGSGTKTASVISDVNNKDLAINLSLEVKESGYLKNAQINILESKEGKGLNFVLGENIGENSLIQSVSKNEITLKQIDSDVKTIISVPFTYKYEKYVNDNNIASDAIVRLTGVYVNKDGNEKEIVYENTLSISWTNQRKVSLESSIQKFINYGGGVILQSLIKVDGTTDEKTLPVRETAIRIDAPVISGQKPSKVIVDANKLENTNGQSVDSIKFNESNYSYNDGIVDISVKNEKSMIEYNEYDEEYLVDQEKIIKEERYYNISGVDEYLVTYVYEGLENIDAKEIVSDIDMVVSTYCNEKDSDANQVAVSNSYKDSFENEVGSIVSLSIENEKNELSKNGVYSNYLNSDKVETIVNSKEILNISNNNIIDSLRINDKEAMYVLKSGEQIRMSDIYTKKVSVSKENFFNILGEEGYIKVYDAGEILAIIDKETQAIDDNNNFIVFMPDSNRRELTYEVSKPITQGNLVINIERAISDSSIDRSKMQEVQSIKTISELVAKYAYVDAEQVVGNVENVIGMADTKTKVNLVVNKDSFSTVSKTEDVEFKIELNNSSAYTDIYGNSTIDITLPVEVENIEIKGAKILYEEGLILGGVEVVDTRTIRVNITGLQKGLNSSIISNGTNVVVVADVTVNRLTPIKNAEISCKVSNEQATNYDETENVQIKYSAPSGVVSVNAITGYKENGYLASVNQGKMTDFIEVHSDRKNAEMTLYVMNNENSDISNVSILGRIPQKDLVDIITGEKVTERTTIDTKMLSEISIAEENTSSFKIYYSRNALATNDLQNSENDWVENPSDLSEMKSYMIIPEDREFKLAVGETLKFKYAFEIPEDLAHHEYIAGEFVTYYTSNEDDLRKAEISFADIAMLTTGNGPEFTLSVKNNKEEVKEYESLPVSVVLKNVGKQDAEQVSVEIPIPRSTLCNVDSVTELSDENAKVSMENNKIVIRSEGLEVGKELSAELNLSVMRKSSNDSYVETTANAMAKDLGKEVNASSEKTKVNDAEIKINEYDRKQVFKTYRIGDEISHTVQVKNLTKDTLKNLNVTKELPIEFNYVSSQLCMYVDGNYTKINDGQYDEASRTITWNLNDLKSNDYVCCEYVFKVDHISNNMTYDTVGTSAKAWADSTDVYESDINKVNISDTVLTISQTTDTDVSTIVNEGENIRFIFTIKNDSKVTVPKVVFKDIFPDELQVKNVNYTNGSEDKKYETKGNMVYIYENIKAGDELKVIVDTYASITDSSEEKTVTNFAVISAENMDEVTSNSLTYTLKNVLAEGEGEEKTEERGSNSAVASSTTSADKANKTYKISGYVWLDSDKDGMRDTSESPMVGDVRVSLVESSTGKIINKVTTDSNGMYILSGVENGKYFVIYDYDTIKYGVTTYKKDGVPNSTNSDAIAEKVTQEGVARTAAISDAIVIDNSSVSDIDLGLVLADKFDLELDMSISKVTVQTSKGTTTNNYSGEKLVKEDIAAKNIDGAKVLVEYEIKITNKGEIPGFVKKIVDYKPQDMEFNSSLALNNGWYTGSNDTIFNASRENLSLAPGESTIIKLVLEKNMTEENTGLVNNQAEIYEDYNIYGIDDYNSTPANKAQRENDLSISDIIILIRTGETLIYTSMIITTSMLVVLAVIVINRKIVINKRKVEDEEGGV